MSKEIQNKILKDFMSRVNKLTVGRSTSDKFYGKVTLRKAADRSKFNARVNRYGITSSGNGTRKFYLSGSKMINDGTYTLTGLRSKLTAAIA